MYQLNNLDIIILFVIGISALIALSRGLVKEVLSIIGWVLGTIAVIYILPVLTPFAKSYIETGWLAGVVTALFILILFLIVWIALQSALVQAHMVKESLHQIDHTVQLSHHSMPDAAHGGACTVAACCLPVGAF